MKRGRRLISMGSTRLCRYVSVQHCGFLPVILYFITAVFLFVSMPRVSRTEDFGGMAASGAVGPGSTGGGGAEMAVTSGGGWQASGGAMESYTAADTSGGVSSGGDPGVKELVNALGSGNSVVSSKAQNDLILVGKPAVEPLFMLSCDHSDIVDQTYAEDTLIKIGAPAGDFLLGVLKEENDEAAQRTEAAYLLGEMKDARAFEPFMDIVNDRKEDPGLWRMAVLKVGKLDDARAIEPLFNLAQELGHSKSESLNAAEISLTQMSASAGEYLLNVLKQGNEGERKEAGNLLGERKDAAAVDPLIKIAEDSAEGVSIRSTALQALGSIGDSQAVEPLIKLAEDPAEQISIRTSAVSVLGRIGDTRAVEPLINILNSSSPKGLQDAAVKALGNIKDSASIETLAGILAETSDYGTQCDALSALVSIGSPAVDTLIGLLNSGNSGAREAAAYGLGRINDERAIASLVESAQDENSGVRFASIWALGKTAKTGDTRVTEVLSGAFEDPEQGVRGQALTVAGSLCEKGLLNEILSLSVEDEDAFIRTKAEMSAVAIAGREGVVKGLEGLRDNAAADKKELYQASLDKAEEKILICSRFKEQYGLNIQDNKYGAFTFEQLGLISSVLASTPQEIVSRIKSLKYDYDVELTPAQNALSYPEQIILKTSFANTQFISELFHEVGHFMPESESEEMKALHGSSSDSLKFQSDYAKTNEMEDFCETAKGYHMDSRAEFSRAISRAENGATTYLDKLLYVSSAYTAYHPDHMMMFKVSDSLEIETRDVPVVFEGKKITAIGGVEVYNPDGTYNVLGLKAYFAGSG